MGYRRKRISQKDINILLKKYSVVGTLGFFTILISFWFILYGLVDIKMRDKSGAFWIGIVLLALGIFAMVIGKMVIAEEQEQAKLYEEEKKRQKQYEEKIAKEKEKKRLEKIASTEISNVDLMTGVQFEEFLMALYIRLGYNVQLTKKSGDFGADLIIEKNGIKKLIQAKCYTTHKVSISAIQEIAGAKNHYKIFQAGVITNNYFTEPAKKLAYENNIELIDREKLVDLMSNNEINVTQIVPEIKKKTIKSDDYNDINHDNNFSKELFNFENKILEVSNTFNVDKTRLLLKDFYSIPLKTTQDYLTYHFGIARIITMIYRLRDITPDFIQDIYELCDKDIEILPKIAKELKNASVPTLTKKAILLTKENKLNEVINLCDFAIKYGFNEERGVSFNIRKIKIMNKLSEVSANGNP